jgi:hypothetical protein
LYNTIEGDEFKHIDFLMTEFPSRPI